MEFCGDEVNESRSSGFYEFSTNILSHKDFLLFTAPVDNFVD